MGARGRAEEERKTNSSKASFPTRLKAHSNGRQWGHSQAGPSILHELQLRDVKKSVVSAGKGGGGLKITAKHYKENESSLHALSPMQYVG